MITIAPKFDVTESESDYKLQGELPGVPAENVVIEFTDPQTLVVRGHADRSHTEGDPSLAPRSLTSGSGEESKRIEGGSGGKKEGKKSSLSSSEESSSSKETSEESSSSSKPSSKYWLSERSFGEFSRVFSFPSSVNQDKVEAKFENGVLDITVPKSEKSGTRKIPIS